MSVENNVPEIRFKGFSDQWQSLSLDKITDVYDGTHQTPTYIKNGVMFLSAENIRTLTSQKFISEKDFKEEFKVYPQKNDVLMTRIGDVGTANVVETDDDKAYYVTLALLKYKQLSPYFLKSAIASPYVQRDIWLRTLHIAFPKKINMNEIKQVAVSCPTDKRESDHLGNTFQKLDNLINQHQQKHEKLSSLKKAMLEKMFPKQGETMPEIRFKGFSGEWEEIELSDEVTFINGRAYSQEELLDKGKYTVLRVGNFYTNSSWYYSDLELGDKYYADNGDLLYTWSASFGPHIWNGDKVIYHYHIWKLELSENVDKLFLLHLLDYDRAKILSGSNGSTMIHITKSAMEAKKVFIPKKDEQIVIGNYFQKLDVLIKHHQQQITKLNNIKQACLSKMFV